MFMPLNMFGINIQLIDVFAVACQRTWMVMPLTVFGIIIQLSWLCR
jgi:hypothetical protein